MLLLTLLDKWVKSNIHIRSVFISTHFDTFSPLSIFSIIQPKLKYLFGIGNLGLQRIRDLAFVCP